MSGDNSNGNGNGLQVVNDIILEKRSGGLGERSVWTSGTRDVRLAERAVRESRTVSDGARSAMMRRLESVVSDPESKPRAFYAAVKALAALSRINLAAVDVAIRALQFEDLADRVAALEERAKRNDMQGFER
jgi:hypothetical protein